MRFILSFILTAGTLGAFVGYGLIPVSNEALVIIGTAALAWVAYRIAVKPCFTAIAEALSFGEESASR